MDLGKTFRSLMLGLVEILNQPAQCEDSKTAAFHAELFRFRDLEMPLHFPLRVRKVDPLSLIGAAECCQAVCKKLLNLLILLKRLIAENFRRHEFGKLI